MPETEREVLARIEATRARMGDTIEEIGDRVNPDRVQAEIKARAREQVEEVKSNVKHKARNAMRDMENEVNDAGRGLWHTIRDNPIPAGMVGVGLAWLMANRTTGEDENVRMARDYRVYATGRPVGTAARASYTGAAYDDLDYGREGRDRPARYDAAREDDWDDQSVADRARERVGGAAESVKGRAADAADEVRDRTSELAHRTTERVQDAQHRAGRTARRAERRVEHAVQENPLAAGAIAAALGFAAGMMVPESQREHEMFGSARDRLMENAEQKARQAGEKAREVARETASESARRAVDEVTGGGSGRERADVSEPGR